MPMNRCVHKEWRRSFAAIDSLPCKISVVGSSIVSSSKASASLLADARAEERTKPARSTGHEERTQTQLRNRRLSIGFAESSKRLWSSALQARRGFRGSEPDYNGRRC